MGNRLIIEVNGPDEIYEMMKNLVMQNPHTMRIIEDNAENEHIRFGDLCIDRSNRQVQVDGKNVFLTAREFDILLYLAEHPGCVFSHREIYEAVWKKKYVYDNANITSHIGHIRKKIELDAGKSKYIQTVHGVGYKFVQS